MATRANCRLHDDYTVGWICALPIEMAAATAMLDEVHTDNLPVQQNDHNAYVLGKVGNHNTVIACLPSGEYGISSAATVAMQLLSSFHSIRFGLMVGIGGGVPSDHADIRLGDVVVSKPTDIYGGVIQYDYGKLLSIESRRTGMLNRPPQILLTALSKLQASHLMGESQMVKFLSEIKRKIPPQQFSIFARPVQEDRLYLADYDHVVGDDGNNFLTCSSCDIAKTIPRSSRGHQMPVIHYGLIASSNQVMKNSRMRDRLSRELGVYCVEMEAAGLMNNYPCLVIRGICDYADSHKNKDWQGYAASTAAAYAKELLLATSISSPDRTRMARDSLADILHNKIDEIAKTQQNMYTMFAKYQSINYCMPVDTNQQLTAPQLNKIFESIPEFHNMECLKSLRFATALSKTHARQNRSAVMNPGRFWLHPRFKKWETNSLNDLIFINGDYKSRLAIRSFCVNFIQLLRKHNEPIIWALQAQDCTHDTTTMAIIKDLVCQILRTNRPLQTEKEASLFCAQLQEAENSIKLIDLLGKAISSIPKLYILVEQNVSINHEGTERVSEQFFWSDAFIGMFDELNRRGSRTVVKIVVIAYSGYASTKQRVVENHQLSVFANRPSEGYFRGTLPSMARKYQRM